MVAAKTVVDSLDDKRWLSSPASEAGEDIMAFCDTSTFGVEKRPDDQFVEPNRHLRFVGRSVC